MEPGIYGIPDDVIDMSYKPGATRPSCDVDLRRRVVRIKFDGGHRDILLEERQIYGDGVTGWVDRAMWPLLWFVFGALATTMMLARVCG